MTRPSTRISIRGEQTREQILQAARRLFAQRGYNNTSVYDLFADAGITKGAFFHHWKSKEELALSIFESLEQNYMENFFAVLETEGKARAKIELILGRLSELTSSDEWGYGRIFALWAAELKADEDKVGLAVNALKLRWLALWKDLLRRAQLDHDLRGDISAENLSFFVVSCIFGVQLMSGKEGSSSAKVAFETLRRTLLT